MNEKINDFGSVVEKTLQNVIGLELDEISSQQRRVEQPTSDGASTRNNGRLQSRQQTLEQMRSTLNDALGRLQGPSFNSPRVNRACFPFVILPQGPTTEVENVVAQICLDSMSMDNWVRADVLARCGVVPIPLDEDDERREKVYVGAGGGQFTSQGKVTLTWYSENQARTQITDNYILSSMDANDFDQLQQIQRNNHASNEEQIMLEKARQKKARDDKRRFKAASRATTPSGLRSPSSMYGGPSLATTRPGSIIGISPQTATVQVMAQRGSGLAQATAKALLRANLPPRDGRDADPNPLLQHKFPAFFNTGLRSRIIREEALQNFGGAKTKDKNVTAQRLKALLCKGASWRRMYPEAPISYKIGVLDVPEGVTMGKLYDFAYSMHLGRAMEGGWRGALPSTKKKLKARYMPAEFELCTINLEFASAQDLFG
ncbi:unnamed protein product [Parascedosporium putredinis]|uniref:Uncharacterized protein n=1 Tax=Parascedosporium putredinis TaxID=1442378 RepID=A0A9P1H5R5_9PEZI|nr:unnamed protein product [Parascedosporium putredinis]CAI7996701.1 unnamed protein product [Parascedosporium putredinis]